MEEELRRTNCSEEILEKKSWIRRPGGSSWRRNHGAEIIEEKKPWRSNKQGEATEEQLWRMSHGGKEERRNAEKNDAEEII